MLYGRCSYPTGCVGTKPPLPWTGPRPNEIGPTGQLLFPVPPERWPYGPPDFHQKSCTLFDHGGEGLFCDCAASDASDVEWGAGA